MQISAEVSVAVLVPLAYSTRVRNARIITAQEVEVFASPTQ